MAASPYLAFALTPKSPPRTHRHFPKLRIHVTTYCQRAPIHYRLSAYLSELYDLWMRNPGVVKVRDFSIQLRQSIAGDNERGTFVLQQGNLAQNVVGAAFRAAILENYLIELLIQIDRSMTGVIVRWKPRVTNHECHVICLHCRTVRSVTRRATTTERLFSTTRRLVKCNAFLGLTLPRTLSVVTRTNVKLITT